MSGELDKILISSSQPDFIDRFTKIRAGVFEATHFNYGSDEDKQLDAILEEVNRRGDTAIAKFTEKFDGVKLTPEQFRVSSQGHEWYWLPRRSRFRVHGYRGYKIAFLSRWRLELPQEDRHQESSGFDKPVASLQRFTIRTADLHPHLILAFLFYHSLRCSQPGNGDPVG